MSAQRVILTAILTLAPCWADEDPRRPAEVSVEGVPRVPEELFAQLRCYQDVVAYPFAGWTPRGVLVRARFDETLQLAELREPGGELRQITRRSEPVWGTYAPYGEDPALLVYMSRRGDENRQIFRWDRGWLVRLSDGVSRNQVHAFSPDGRRAVVASNRRNGRDTDLYLLDLRTGQWTLVLRADGEFWGASDWSPDGDQLLLWRYVSENEAWPHLLDLGKDTAPRPIPLPAGVDRAGFGPEQYSGDGRGVYLSCDARGEFRHLARVDLETLEWEWISADLPWDVEELAVDRSSGRVAFATNQDGRSQLYLLDASGRRTPVDLPIGIVDGLEFSPDGAQLGFTFSRPDAPSDVYSLALEDRRLVRWTSAELVGLDPEGFVVPEQVRLTSFDEREIPAYYYRPKGASAEAPAPVVVAIHGGPESQMRPYFRPDTQFLVRELGIAVVAPNVRGSTGYGKTYTALDDGLAREDAVRDMGALLDWIERRPELDGGRVCVSGASYGGYLALASLVHYGDRLRAGIGVVGISSFVTFLENTSPYRQDLRRAEYGDERDPETRAFFERISPLNRAESICSALLLVHGENDPRVPVAEARQLAARVREREIPVWTLYAANEGHGFRRKSNRDYLQAVEVLFLREHLLGEGNRDR